MVELRYRDERRGEDWVVIDNTTGMAAENRTFESQSSAKRAAIGMNVSARMRSRSARIAALEVDVARATALLRRLVAMSGECIDPREMNGRPWCWKHRVYWPCPVGEARAWLEQREAP